MIDNFDNNPRVIFKLFKFAFHNQKSTFSQICLQKAIMECEAEWAQNKKLVDLKNRSVRSAVPKGLPYFFVDFAMDPGYAHVIEDEQDFPHNFAQVSVQYNLI